MKQRILSGKISLLFAAFILMLQVVAGAAVAAPTDTQEQGAELQAYIEAAESIVLKSQNLSDWAAVALSRAGVAVPDSYLAAVENGVADQKGEFTRVTDYERTVLGVRAAGGDPTWVAGYDLVGKIVNHPRMTAQGVNGPIYALIALANGKYEVPSSAKWNADTLIDWLLAQQNTDGWWTLTAGGKSSVDVTAMALTALAPYKEMEKVQFAIDKAVAWLSSEQQEDGGFSENGQNCETEAQVIIALTSIGIDPSGAQFTNENGSAWSHFLTYRLSDGSFAHTIGGAANSMSTEQAFQALVADQLFLNGKGGLFSYTAQAEVSLQVEGPDKPVVSGKVTADKAMAAAVLLFQKKNVPYKIKKYSFGDMITSIGGFDNGKFGGYDGWSYYVIRAGKVISPNVGMADFALQQGDKLVLYYGDYGTPMIQSVTLTPAQPKVNEPFQVKVDKIQWVWEDNKNNEKIDSAAGVTVQIGDQSAVTNEEGIASFNGLKQPGVQEIAVTAYKEGASPAVVRAVWTAGVTADYTDKHSVDEWAAASVEKAQTYGLMLGVSKTEQKFAPQKPVTRAEFAAILVKMLGIEPTKGANGGFKDVAAGSWYGGYVAIARQKGIVSGATAETFAPNQAITREQMAVMLAKTLRLKTEGASANYKDLKQASTGTLSYIAAVSSKGLMVGSSGNFYPKRIVSRETAAVVAVKAFESLAN